jgi:flagellar motor protein MotB
VITFLGRDRQYPFDARPNAAAMGETRPHAPNGSPQGRVENRRAEIRILTNRTVSGE